MKNILLVTLLVSCSVQAGQKLRDVQEVRCWQLGEVYYGIITDRARGISRKEIESKFIQQAGSDIVVRDYGLSLVNTVFSLMPLDVDAERVRESAKAQCMNQPLSSVRN